MGNHAVGRSFVALAVAMAERRKDGETALDILDAAADRAEVRGADAEFDGEDYPDTPFGSLLLEAFAPAGRVPDDYDEDNEDGNVDAWWEEVLIPFRDRYGLC